MLCSYSQIQITNPVEINETGGDKVLGHKTLQMFAAMNH